MHAIEATRQSNWLTHVSDDYTKAADQKNRDVASYFFVGVGDPGAQVDAAQKADCVQRFVGLGVEPENVNILVGLDLVTVLQDSRCARIRLVYLKLRTCPRVFTLLTPGRMQSLSSSLYQPNGDDFAADRVFAPEISQQILDKLVREGRALVRGYGAAGKTTLVQVLASRPELAGLPFYYTDLAAVGDVDGVVDEVRDDMVEFGGAGITFAIDNIHLMEGAATNIANEWTALSEPVRPMLLLLGREQRSAQGSPLGMIESVVLRARETALKGVLTRLLGRTGVRLPFISVKQMDEWMRTFGGDPEDSNSSVDLIAFSAAAERRLDAISKGDLTLTPDDAVDGVRSHYWQPVLDTPEGDNVLRLAALAQIEIDATEELLTRRAAGFARSMASGLVIGDIEGGEHRRRYKLAHPALARLLLSAVGVGDGGRRERLAAASTSIPLAFRLAGVGPDEAERSAALDIAMTSVADGAWITSCANLDELSFVISALLRRDGALRAKLDEALSGEKELARLAAATRHSSNWIRALAVFRGRRFDLTLDALRTLAIERTRTGAVPTFYTSPAHEFVVFLRRHPAGEQLLSSIDLQEWSEAQCSYARAGLIPETVTAAAWLAKKGRQDLARPLCDRQITDAVLSRWSLAGLPHLSHLVRLSSLDAVAIQRLLEELESSRWLQRQVLNASTGDLSGALFSLSNHLPIGCLPRSLPTILASRVTSELRISLLEDGELGLRVLSLLGSATRLLPQYSIPLEVELPPDERIAAMIRARVRKMEVGQIGTHEIQLWLGIKELDRKRTVKLESEQKMRMIRLLDATPTPSPKGEETKRDLLAWLRTHG